MNVAQMLPHRKCNSSTETCSNFELSKSKSNKNCIVFFLFCNDVTKKFQCTLRDIINMNLKTVSKYESRQNKSPDSP